MTCAGLCTGMFPIPWRGTIKKSDVQEEMDDTSHTHLLYNQYDFERLNKSIEELPDIQAVETFYKRFAVSIK